MPEYTYEILVNGQPYSVTVGDLTMNPLMVQVNGRTYQVEMGGKTAPPMAVAPIRLSETAVVAPQPAMQAVFHNQSTIAAPMPGHIINMATHPGERVKKGQTLCALEAMKMKNAFAPPKTEK